MTLLHLDLPFPAAHRIAILGEMEPLHGHEFRCRIEVAVDDERDAALLGPALQGCLAALAHTRLEAVAAAEGGHPSAERIAAHVHRRLAAALAGDRAARVQAVTVTEAPGCRATFRV